MTYSRGLILVCLTVLSGCGLSGCGLQAKLDTVGAQAPGTLAEIEQLKTAVATAPLAGCVGTVQQAGMLLKALANGTPAIPISPTPAPPIITVTPPIVTPPPPPDDGGSSGSPIVTPNTRSRHRNIPYRQQIGSDYNVKQASFDWTGTTFYIDTDGSVVHIDGK